MPWPQKKDRCPYCGKEVAPGPMVMHKKTCDLNPTREGHTVDQPRRACKWGCGKESTAGAITHHELYGCDLRPEDGTAKQTCRYCHKVTTTPGPLARHEQVCDGNPANHPVVVVR